jgi:hypothetical protein
MQSEGEDDRDEEFAGDTVVASLEPYRSSRVIREL